jgi:Flp pilus assembly protein TadG
MWKNRKFMRQFFNKITVSFYDFIRDNRGVTIAAFAIVIPIIIASTGVAVDMSRAYLVKKQLGQAIDAAALATAGSSGDEAELESRMQTYFNRNFKDGRLGNITLLDMDPVGSELTIKATARVDTLFMRIWGKNYVDVTVQNVIRKELRGIEVALVMDNTGSMSTNNNIQALRDAATSFVNIMFDRAPDPEVIKVGLIPYSTSVNVGPYGLGLNPDGSQYADGRTFINNPLNRPYTTNPNSFDWLGCVQESEPTDTQDHEGPWDMYSYCMEEDEYYPICEQYYYYGYVYFSRYPNYICPTSHVTPLMSNQNTLLTRIAGMQASGNTLSNVGMTWGWRVISPEFPFEEGVAYDDQKWRKAVIMMTDGQSAMHPTYSAYRRTQDHTINSNDLDDKLASVCEAMKNKEIIIYTATFTSAIDDTTKDYYRDCATDSTKYYDAPGKQDLVDAFESISRELSNLYIKE